MSNIRKPKQLPYLLIDRFTDPGRNLYAALDALIEQHYEDLKDARIALVWALTWQPDVDGNVRLGAAQRASDLGRELAPYDFAIQLSKTFFEEPLTTDQMRRYVLDTELAHCMVKYDADGDAVVDQKGRPVYRMRDFDTKCFSFVVERYGPDITKSLQQFTAALERVAARTAWVGFRGLREQLAAAGADIGIDTIGTWTEAERRAADKWAYVVAELKRRQVDADDIPAPPHVQAATRQRYDSQGAVPHGLATVEA
jgi:hypothetical protein